MPLTLTYRGVVYPWQCDHMNHMNVMWYVGKFDEGTWTLFGMLGLTAPYLREHNYAMAAVQQDITYKRELVAGDLVAVYSGFIELREKSTRFYHEMRNETTGEVAAFGILTGVFMDSTIRKATPFPDDFRARVEPYMIPDPLAQ
jgi:acyl-CoA thioester hydrolase